MSAFSTDDGGGVFVLVIDTAEMQLTPPVAVYPAEVSPYPVPAGPTPIVRLRMTYAEAEQLWLLLNDTIGTHVAERQAVARDMQAYKERFGDFRVPTTEEYQRARSTLQEREGQYEDPVFVHAQEIVNRFEQATQSA